MPRAMNWQGLRAGPRPGAQSQSRRSFSMRYRLLAIAAMAGAMAAPIAAQAQGVVTTGVARGPLVVTDDAYGIAVDQRPAFREYIVRERVPNYTIPDRVIVGGVLPETGVTYYLSLIHISEPTRRTPISYA